MRRDFVANVSHELRTPLTVVNGFVETMSDMPKLENDMARRALHLMGEQTQRMGRLVDDLLTLSKLDNALNALHEETVEVPALLRVLHEKACAERGQAWLAAGAGERLHPARQHRGVAQRFRQPDLQRHPLYAAGSEITLRWQEQDGQPCSACRTAARHRAATHPPPDRAFLRVDRSRSRETGGTGLGWPSSSTWPAGISALDIVSEEGKGSTFSIVFPVKRRLPLPMENAG